MLLSVYRHMLPLKAPYELSFGTLRSYDTFYIVLRADDRVGLGEITPLPGYSHETPESVGIDLQRLTVNLENGLPLTNEVQALATCSPFTACGIACAYETWREGCAEAFGRAIPNPVLLAAFCGGNSPANSADQARQLIERGYTTLKMKVGRLPVSEDAARIAAVAEVLPPGIVIRLDANQVYSMNQAKELCRLIEEIQAVQLLEQPFQPHDWTAHENLAASTLIPIMLDESIWAEDDVHRAADCGARFVKFKLCKHLGMAGCQNMINLAFGLGLRVVLGNGVQTALGNHLEVRIFQAMGIPEASESNGFLKLAQSPFIHGLAVSDGFLVDHGLGNPLKAIEQGTLVAQAKIRLV